MVATAQFNDHAASARWQRHETKYLISEAQAAEIRQCCLRHLAPDPHSSGQAGCDYPILTIYLDSPGRDLLRQTISKKIDRYKLRVRMYRERDESSDGRPWYFEVKRKTDGVVHKTRARVDPEHVEALFNEKRALFDGAGHCDPTTVTNINQFLQMRSQLGAEPVVGVFYTREAYEENSAQRVRITFDRNLHYGILPPPGSGQREMWWPVDPGGVILEIKFTNTYPFWVADMIRRAELLRCGVCKYVACARQVDGSALRASA